MCGLLVLTALAAEAMPYPALSRLRTADATVSASVSEALAYSSTFRDLVATIERSDGLVYLSGGPCPEHAKACLLMHLDQAGPNRMLRIYIPPGKGGIEAAGSIAHELQHAIEILSNRSVRTTDDLFTLFQMIGLDTPSSSLPNRIHYRFETAAALRIGEQVREEFRRKRRQNPE